MNGWMNSCYSYSSSLVLPFSLSTGSSSSEDEVSDESLGSSKKVSMKEEHSSAQLRRLADARHCWSAIISGDIPHCWSSSLVWCTRREYSPPGPSCMTLNSQLSKLLRRSNCATVHLNHFMRNTREVRPWETITRFVSQLGSWSSLPMSMSRHSDSRKPAMQSSNQIQSMC